MTYEFKPFALCLPLAMCASTVFAQSTVTLYGIADAAVYDKQMAGEVRLKTLANGGMSTSRWGLRGSEDLGSGIKANFDISSFFQVDTGGSGRSAQDTAGYWGRYAWVGLSSADYGTLRLGRISTPTWISSITGGAFGDSTTFSPYLLHTYLPSATQPMITGNGTLDSAWNNSVSYASPIWSGFGAGVQAAPSEGTTAGRRVSGFVNYRADALAASLTVDSVENATLATGAPAPALASATRPVFTASKVRTYQGGVNYDFRVVKVYAQFNRTSLKSTTAREVKLTTSSVSASVPLGLGNVLVAYARTNDDTTAVASTSRKTASAAYDYFLSKRTDVYAVVMNDRVSGLSGGTGFAVGVRHGF